MCGKRFEGEFWLCVRLKFANNGCEGGEEDLPRDAKVVKTLLKSMGVGDYEPRVVHQF